ncbi:SixA phosphatase family protein [Flavobacterium macrobrachii]|uniref:Histidine phosphatase family protein n=1 Tax=Flavobacterium macrobrachii TaxID=591204 RepID=A0ABS2CZM7_9FLAO|nr:histidine phosphatase family protein [Flavobacterium macrobrachii]MBM6499615.1 histidine phosphatase family protein [Flavobacterium macrobrachii]
MKQLMLVRHAKSSWDAPLRDFDRPLTSKGIHDAHMVSSDLSKHIPKMYLLWSSPAKRATETAVIFAQNLSYPIENIDFKEELYTFDGKRLEEIIKSCPDDYDNLIVFGHNEAITNFVNKFGNIFVDNVPTSGFVKITFETNSWKNLSNGKTTKVIFPKEI